jgi:Cupin
VGLHALRHGRITAIDPQGHYFVDDVGVGDLWYFPSGVPHSIQGLSPDGCEFLLVFDDGDFDEDNTFLLSGWFKHTPNEVLLAPELVKAHLNLDDQAMAALHKEKFPVVPG